MIFSRQVSTLSCIRTVSNQGSKDRLGFSSSEYETDFRTLLSKFHFLSKRSIFWLVEGEDPSKKYDIVHSYHHNRKANPVSPSKIDIPISSKRDPVYCKNEARKERKQRVGLRSGWLKAFSK